MALDNPRFHLVLAAKGATDREEVPGVGAECSE